MAQFLQSDCAIACPQRSILQITSRVTSVQSHRRITALSARDVNTLFDRAQTFNWVPSPSWPLTTGGIAAEVEAALQVAVTCVERHRYDYKLQKT